MHTHTNLELKPEGEKLQKNSNGIRWWCIKKGTAVHTNTHKLTLGCGPRKKKKNFETVAEPRLIKLSSLALCGYANIINAETCEIFRRKLKGI